MKNKAVLLGAILSIGGILGTLGVLWITDEGWANTMMNTPELVSRHGISVQKNFATLWAVAALGGVFVLLRSHRRS